MLDSEQFKDLFKVDEFEGIVNLTEESLRKYISYRKDDVQEVSYYTYTGRGIYICHIYIYIYI